MDGRRPWPDLPQGIVETIFNKLHFPDQVRALAVCKSWRDCKDYVKSSDCLPWVVCVKSGNESVTCGLFDPYLQKDFMGHSYRNQGMMCASKHGWVIQFDFTVNSFFLHNPFTRDIILLPFNFSIDEVTMKVNREPLKCEIFALSRNDHGCITIETCCFSKKDDCVGDYQSHTFDDKGDECCFSMLYMKGSIYVLFNNNGDGKYMFKSYSLKDKSWKLLNEGFPEPYERVARLYRCWLLEMNENLMMVRADMKGRRYKWIIFRFDWFEMSWVVENGLKNCAIFISDLVAFSEPLTHRDGKKSEESCKLYYGNLNNGVNGFTCRSLNEAGRGTKIQSHEYERIKRLDCNEFQFVRPPYFGI